MKKIILSFVLLLIVAAGLVLSAQQSNRFDSSKLQVATTFYPLYDFAQQVGGDAVRVSNITPVGAEPHDYEPSPRALAAAHASAVFIYNGGPFEPWITNFLGEYKGVAVRANAAIDPLSSEGGVDPHFWLDPVLAQTMVTTIRDGLVRADPTHKATYHANAAQLVHKLALLDSDFRQGLANCQLRTVVSAHDALGYVAKRYNFAVRAIAGLSSSDEPSPAELAEISQLVRSQHIAYILFEQLASPRLAATIAAETGAKTLVFDPIEGLTNENNSQGHNYLSLQRANLAALRTALACR